MRQNRPHHVHAALTACVLTWVAAPARADDPEFVWRHAQPWIDTCVLDSEDNILLGAEDRTQKIRADGTLAWSCSFAWPSGHTILNWTAADSQGNVFRTGYVDGGTYGFLVLKYDPDGNLLWSTLQDAGFGPESVRSGVDEHGDVYVFGQTRPTGTYHAFLTMKFDAAGHHEWSRIQPLGNEPRAFVVQGGRVVGSGNGASSFATVCYDYDGNELWFDAYHPGNSGAFDVAVGPAGQVAVCGWGFVAGAPSNNFGTVVMYDPLGTRAWIAYYNSPYGGVEIFRKLALGADGSVIATGTGLSAVDDAWSTIKLDASGNLQWAQLYDHTPWSSSAGFEFSTSLAVSPSGSAYVGGLSARTCSGLGLEGHLVKYTPNGSLEWARPLATPVNCAAAYPTRILRDRSGAIVSASTHEVIQLREPVGSVYCAPSVANSSGQPAVITATGSALVVASELTLTARQLPLHASGYFLASRAQGFAANPGGSQGHLCLGGAIGRFAAQVQSSGPTGRITVAVDLANLPGLQPQAVMPGETWNFQAWFRDANPTVTSNFTDAVSITYL